MARPQKTGVEKRTVTIRVRFTPDEKKQLWEKARDAGHTPSDFIRVSVLHSKPLRQKPTPPRVALIQLQAELGKIGSNINQIAHQLNLSRLTGEPHGIADDAIIRVLERLDGLSLHIQSELKNGH